MNNIKRRRQRRRRALWLRKQAEKGKVPAKQKNASEGRTEGERLRDWGRAQI